MPSRDPRSSSDDALADTLMDLAGRTTSRRADTRATHRRLIEAVQMWVREHGQAPRRLTDVASMAGVSTATAYRHFASVDDAIQAFVLQLPTRAVELFEASGGHTDDPLDSFGRWNESWVTACVEHGDLAVYLRSPQGFLERRDAGDPVINYACAQIEPLLDELPGDTTMMLFTWNVTSDPREVLDLIRMGWNGERIARFVTESVLATPSG